MNTTRFPVLIKTIYDAVSELEEMFTKDDKKRHFTPDGHMVGTIGEVLAAYHYDITLHPASKEKHDGEIDGRQVQIKATQRTAISISNSRDLVAPDFLLVLKIQTDGTAEEIYNGPGKLVWDFLKNKSVQKNGQRKISLKQLKDLTLKVANADTIKRVRP